jgi:hypothetical protein
MYTVSPSECEKHYNECVEVEGECEVCEEHYNECVWDECEVCEEHYNECVDDECKVCHYNECVEDECEMCHFNECVEYECKVCEEYLIQKEMAPKIKIKAITDSLFAVQKLIKSNDFSKEQMAQLLEMEKNFKQLLRAELD